MLVVRYEGGDSGSSLSSSVATTTTSIFDEFSSLDDQDAPPLSSPPLKRFELRSGLQQPRLNLARSGAREGTGGASMKD